MLMALNRFIYVSVVRYYTTITFDTSWSLMSSLLKAHIIIILYGDGGETESIELKRYHYIFTRVYKVPARPDVCTADTMQGPRIFNLKAFNRPLFIYLFILLFIY